MGGKGGGLCDDTSCEGTEVVTQQVCSDLLSCCVNKLVSLLLLLLLEHDILLTLQL